MAAINRSERQNVRKKQTKGTTPGKSPMNHGLSRSRFRRLFHSRSLSFTREGKYFVVLTLGIGFAAINTGNNLLFLLLGMMLSLIVGSGILSEISLLFLSVNRRIPSRVFAGQPFLMGISLTNAKRHIPSFSIQVEDIYDGQTLGKRCYFLKIPAKKTQDTSYRHTFSRRGLFHLSNIKMCTKFPFCLFQKSLTLFNPQEMIVYPAVFPLLAAEGSAMEMGDYSSGKTDRRGEFWGLREYQWGDDPRGIHWRKSANVGHLVVRQDENRSSHRIAIFLDNRQSQIKPSPTALEQQERAVSYAASLAVHHIRQGYIVELQTYTVNIGPGSGEKHLDHLLTALALLEFTTEKGKIAIPPPKKRKDCIYVQPQYGQRA